MIKRFLKSSAIFFVILGVSFSNVPFYALSGLISSYEKSSGIVDKMWLVQQNHDSDVVDKFSSLRNISEKLKVQEAMAASSFIGNSNIVYTNGGVPGAITPNASTIDGDLLVFYHYSRATGGNETVTLPAGFTTVFNSVTANYGLVAVGWRIKQAGDTTFTATITNHTSSTSGETVIEFIQTYRGTDTTSPIVNYTASLSTWASGLNVGPIAAPATATVTDGDMAVVFGGKFENVTGQTVLSGDSLTWTAVTILNTNLGTDAGGVVQTGLNATGVNQTVTAKTVTTTGTAQVGAGRMFIIKKAPDTTPPTPSPMTFATVPANDSTTQISMTATTATDATTPPVSYFFTLDNTNCGANAGTGGTSSAWQAETTYIDSVLTANKCYGYTVKARDSVGTPNETAASGISSAYTSANTPGTPTLGSPTTSTLNLTNAENSNPTANPTTNYAVQVVTTTPSDATWLNQWVNGSGTPSATAVWLTDAQLDALVLQGLQASTLYGVKVKAKNQDNDETPLSAEGQGTTSAPAATLTISQTAGSKVATKNSGDVDQYAHDTACTGAATCAAFTLAASGGAVNVTSIKITESGTATANTELSDLNLYYDTDGNWSDAGAETLFGTTATFAADQTATVSGTLNISSGATAYIYARYDLANGAVYPTGGATVNFQIAASGDVVSGATESGTGTLAGTQTLRPNVTSISYPQSPDGGRNGDTFVIYGAGFGTSCANATTTIGSLNLTCVSVSNTVATTTIPSTQTTTYGGTGASGLLVTVGGTADDTNQTYYVYPNVTVPPTNDSGREASDVTVQGTRFGATQGTVQFTGAFDNPSPISAAITSWSDTSITVTVPASITDSTYLGDIKVTRNSDSKTDLVYDTNGFRVLPRITTNTANSGIIADRIMITGDHLCQGASCPVSPNRSVANDNVKFGSTQALDGDFVNSGASPCSINAQAWTHAEICVNVPAGTPVGSQPTIVRSNAYDSGTVAFTVSSIVPTDPTNLIQKDNNLVTITTEATSSSTPIRYTFDTSSAVTGGTMYAQVEVRPVTGVNKDFTSTCSANPYCFEGLGTAYSGGTINLLATSTPVDDIYHWQARACYNKNGTHTTACSGTWDNPSALWVSYGGNLETATDFKIDTTAPVITTLPSSGSPGTNSASITWATANEQSTSRIEYDTAGTFTGGYDCAGTSECSPLIDTSPTVNSHSVTLSNLNSGTTYTYRVRSKDATGNETISSNYTFQTSSNLSPAKTTSFHIAGATSTATNGNPGIYQFYATTTETNISQKSAFVTLTGIYETTNVTPTNSQVTVRYESETDNNIYTLPGGPVAGTFRGYFKIVRKVNTVNTASVSTLTVTPDAGTTLYINSADLVMTYSYTP